MSNLYGRKPKGLEGYKYKSEEERREAEKWMKQHGHELPNMSDGARINGDPILSFDRDLELLGIVRKMTNQEDSSYRDDLIILYLISYISNNPPNKQSWARLLSAVGLSQKKIAKALDISFYQVNRMLCNA